MKTRDGSEVTDAILSEAAGKIGKSSINEKILPVWENNPDTSLDYLLKGYRRLSKLGLSSQWWQEQMNKSTSSGEKKLAKVRRAKYEWLPELRCIKYYFEGKVFYLNAVVITGVDPAVGESENSGCFFGAITIAACWNGMVFVINEFCERGVDVIKQVDVMKYLRRTYKQDLTVIERNGYQGALAKWKGNIS